MNVLITGISRGIGKAIALEFAKNKYNIIGCAKSDFNGLSDTKNLVTSYGVDSYIELCDISNEEKIKKFIYESTNKLGGIDILINNAGTGAVAPAEDITDAQFDSEVQIDLFGSFRVAKQAMIPAKYGRIINIASMYGLVGNKVAGCAPYHAAKGGVINLTRALAAEWG